MEHLKPVTGVLIRKGEDTQTRAPRKNGDRGRVMQLQRTARAASSQRSWERGRGQTLSQGLQESVALLSP